MRYAHILAAVACELWAIQPEKLETIVAFLALQASGDKLSADELQAFQAKVSNQAARDVARREGAVAVLPLRGVIANRMNMLGAISGGTSSEAFGRSFDAAVDDSGVKAIIVDTDSLGGVVHGADETSARMFAARGKKPIIAHVNAIAASAAYWIVSAADEVVLSPTAEVGSIGILGAHDDVSAALEKAGVKKTVFVMPAAKADGHPFSPASDEFKAYQEQKLAHYYDLFVRRVASNRGVTLAAVKDGFGRGRMVTAAAAVAEKMADRIATIEETIARFSSPAPAKSKSLASRKRTLAIAEAN